MSTQLAKPALLDLFGHGASSRRCGCCRFSLDMAQKRMRCNSFRILKPCLPQTPSSRNLLPKWSGMAQALILWLSWCSPFLSIPERGNSSIIPASVELFALHPPSGPQIEPIWHLHTFGKLEPAVMQTAPKPHEVCASDDVTWSCEPGHHMGVSIVMGVPPNGWSMRENPIKMDDLGVTPISGNHHIWDSLICRSWMGSRSGAICSCAAKDCHADDTYWHILVCLSEGAELLMNTDLIAEFIYFI